MSKTKGNVLDPLDIIQRFGTDATRFTLAAMAAPSTDIAFSESRTGGYRNFANKIWNAARFMFMNVDRVGAGLMRETEESRKVAEVVARLDRRAANLEDRWILSRFNGVTRDVNDALETYRFHEAANRIYDFFWGDFCDWYIEIIKPRLAPEADLETANTACRNLVSMFDASLRLLHPLMPFITEEIWQAIYDGKPPVQSIALAAFPQCDVSKIDESAETEMGVVKRITTAIRDGRARLKIQPKLRVDVELYMGDKGREILRENRSSIERLANVSLQLLSTPPVTFSKIETSPVREGPGQPKNCVTGAEAYDNLASYSMRFLYEAQIDIATETKRLRKELSKIELDLSNAGRQLGNEDFLAKAPANVIEGLRKRTQELAALREKTKSELDQLK
ncbi:MAG TPA: class I tRNA ligase family protein, partial [Terriglobales bacterium]|nr:class I tRNA ligase family protein [Terriglobales bacterium]